jgi:hypothetical protein
VICRAVLHDLSGSILEPQSAKPASGRQENLEVLGSTASTCRLPAERRLDVYMLETGL